METGQESSKASNEEIMVHMQREAEQPKGAEARKMHHFAENELPWSEAEELLSPITHRPLHRRGALQTAAVFALVFSMGSGLVWATKPFFTGAEKARYGVSADSASGPSSSDFIKEACKMA